MVIQKQNEHWAIKQQKKKTGLFNRNNTGLFNRNNTGLFNRNKQNWAI